MWTWFVNEAVFSYAEHWQPVGFAPGQHTALCATLLFVLNKWVVLSLQIWQKGKVYKLQVCF